MNIIGNIAGLKRLKVMAGLCKSVGVNLDITLL